MTNSPSLRRGKLGPKFRLERDPISALRGVMDDTTLRIRVSDLTNDQLLQVYSELNATRLDYNERKWETVKSSSVLVLGLLAAVGGLAQSEKIKVEHGFLFLGLATLFVGFWVYRWTLSNLERESELQYHVEFPMYQIERLLGLHGILPPELRWLPSADRLFGRKHTSPRFQVTEEFQQLFADKAGTSGDSDPSNQAVRADKEAQLLAADRAIHSWVKARLSHHRFVDTVGGYSLLLLGACGTFGFYLCWLDQGVTGLIWGVGMLALCWPSLKLFDWLSRLLAGRP